MPDQRSATDPTNVQGAPSQLIEKGWTLYDAAERPIGNVTDVDTQRGVIMADGRPAGFEAFEVPLTFVARAGDNEVHLTKVIDAATATTDRTPRFEDAPRTPPDPSSTVTTRPRPRAQVATPTTPLPDSPGLRASMPRTSAVGVGAEPTPISAGTPPAATAPTDPRVRPMAMAAPEDENGWSIGRIAAGGLAFGGLAVASYFWRRRMQRKSRFEQFFDLSANALDATADFARERHPAWWGGLAAAALPVAAYSFWPSRPTPVERAHHQADDLTDYLSHRLGDLERWLPAAGMMTASASAETVRRVRKAAGQLERPSQWTPSSEAAMSAALVAVSALAIYLARRSTHAPRATRIGDIMTRHPRTISPTATVADAALMMRRLNVGALPVCDGSRLVGMVTDRDITIRSAAEGRDPHLTPVRDVMTAGVAWATEDDPVEDAARIMREHRIRRLPIVNDRHSLVGVVSLGDLAVDIDDADMSGDTLETISEPSQPRR